MKQQKRKQIAPIFWGMGVLLTIFPSLLLAQITGTSSYLSHVGGSYHVFVNLNDQYGEHLSEVSESMISLRVNYRPIEKEYFDYRHRLLDLQTFIVADFGEETPAILEAIKAGVLRFGVQKHAADQVILNLNGLSGQRFVANNKEEMKQYLEKAVFEPDALQKTEVFLQSIMGSLKTNERRRWMIFLTNQASSISDASKHMFEEALKEHDISFIPVVLGSSFSQWLHRVSLESGGKFYQAESLERLPRVMDEIVKRLHQEYVLGYNLSSLGNVKHHLEIEVDTGAFKVSLDKDVQVPWIWGEKDSPLPSGYALVLLGLPTLGIGFLLRKRKKLSVSEEQPYFEILTLGEGSKEIALESKVYTMDFLSSVETKGNLRLSSNLNKVLLTPQEHSFLLEDKNYKNALLINRRRIRKILLQDGDILDIGDWTLLFRNSKKKVGNSEEEDKKALPLRFEKPRGPLRRGIATLVNEHSKQEFYLTRNLVFIGRSENNDLVLKGKQIAPRHAKIVRVGGQYKIQNLNPSEGTYVNNRRIEQRFITDGDHISFENYRFKFRIGKS